MHRRNFTQKKKKKKNKKREKNDSSSHARIFFLLFDRSRIAIFSIENSFEKLSQLYLYSISRKYLYIAIIHVLLSRRWCTVKIGPYDISYMLIPRLSAHNRTTRNGEILGGGRGTFFVLFPRVVWARDRADGRGKGGGRRRKVVASLLLGSKKYIGGNKPLASSRWKDDKGRSSDRRHANW